MNQVDETESFEEFTLTRLVKRSVGDEDVEIMGRSERVKVGPPSQGHYEQVLDALATIRLHKVRGYGEGRYRPDGVRYSLSLAYGDLERKMLRLKHQIFSGDRITSQVIELEIMEAAADLANYAALMVQLCTILRAKSMSEA